MSIAEYRAAKKVLADFDAFLIRYRNPHTKVDVEVKVVGKAPRLSTTAYDPYPDNISFEGLNKRASGMVSQAMDQVIADYRAALVSRIKALHVSAVAEACALITEEPPE